MSLDDKKNTPKLCMDQQQQQQSPPINTKDKLWLWMMAWSCQIVLFSLPVSYAYVVYHDYHSHHMLYKRKNAHPKNFVRPSREVDRWSSSSSFRRRRRSSKMSVKEEDNSDVVKKQYLYQRNNIWTESLTTITGQWKIMYLQLQKHHQREGHLSRIKDAKLRSWLIYQRTLYHKNKLHSDRQHALEELGEQWKKSQRRRRSKKNNHQQKRIQKFLPYKDDDPSNNHSLWEYYCQRLMDFYFQNGHTQVPFSSKKYQQQQQNDDDDSHLDLAIWINNQKQSFHKGTLSQDKYEILSSMGVLFTQSRKEFTWMSHYRALYYFVEAYGHSRVPERYAHHPSLGQWVSQLRHNQGKNLDSQQRQALDALNFQWESVPQQNWLQTYEGLKQYLMEKNHNNNNKKKNVSSLPTDNTTTTVTSTMNDLQDFTDFPDEFRSWIRHQLRQYPKWESILNLPMTTTTTEMTVNKEQQQEEQEQQTIQNNDISKSSSKVTDKMKSIVATRKRLLDEIGFQSWSKNLIQNSKEKKGNKNKKAINQNDWNALFDQMRERGINANAPLTVLPNQKNKQQEVKFQRLSEQDLIDLWNEEEDDEDDDDFF